MWGECACVYVCVHMRVSTRYCVYVEVRGHQVRVGSTMWIPGIKLRSSDLVANAITTEPPCQPLFQNLLHMKLWSRLVAFIHCLTALRNPSK